MSEREEPAGPSAALAALLAAVAADLPEHAALLNRLDGVAGDGDLGITATTAAAALAELAPAVADLETPAALRRVGTELSRRVPSTAGTLVAFAFLAAGRAAAAGSETPGVPLAGRALDAAATAIAERGSVAIGDRTMLDALRPAVDALQRALHRNATVAEAARDAAEAAEAGAVATADMTATVGRAGWLKDRAQGHEDAGARLVALVFAAAARHFEERGSS